ncbi:hypothetical protein E2542_SST20610 [Spatholobus suberectus]|nr:hypothetical protein E2542_SST20610 [Spatholobus suberectus]
MQKRKGPNFCLSKQRNSLFGIGPKPIQFISGSVAVTDKGGDGGGADRRRLSLQRRDVVSAIDDAVTLSRRFAVVDASLSGGSAVVWIHESRGPPVMMRTCWRHFVSQRKHLA